jgi:hypothetical protein
MNRSVFNSHPDSADDISRRSSLVSTADLLHYLTAGTSVPACHSLASGKFRRHLFNAIQQVVSALAGRLL